MKPFNSLILYSLLVPALISADSVPVGVVSAKNQKRPRIGRYQAAKPVVEVIQTDESVIEVVQTEVPQEETAQSENSFISEDAEEEAPIEIMGYTFDRNPLIVYSNSHHRLVLITVREQGDYTLELEDGSVWKISKYDGTKAFNWQVQDPLTITQNNQWFSSHKYRIINKATGSSVEATLFLGPVEGGQYSRFVTYVDHARGEVYLNDNTHWDISYQDKIIFRDWAVNDHVIIGTNSDTSFFDWSSDTLLINVNMNNAIRAKQY